MQKPGEEPPELDLEYESEVEELGYEPQGSSTIMPWLFPVVVIAGFFAFVVLLVLFIL